MRFLTERGQNVNGQPNIIYVSMDNGVVWNPLHEFLEVRSLAHITSTNGLTVVRFDWQLQLIMNYILQ